MDNIKFMVKLNRAGNRAIQYVERTDRAPVQTTTDRKRALVMGKFAAQDLIKTMTTPSCRPELVSVKVPA